MIVLILVAVIIVDRSNDGGISSSSSTHKIPGVFLTSHIFRSMAVEETNGSNHYKQPATVATISNQ